MPTGPANDINLAQTFSVTGKIPFTDFVPEEILLAPAARQAMGQLALSIQPIGAQALRQRVAGRHFINDMSLGQAGITVYRVRTLNAQRALNRYFKLFVEQARNEKTGRLQLNDRTPQIRAALATAWQNYTQSAEDQPTPQGLRAFLASQSTSREDQANGEAERQPSEALQYINSAAQMLHNLNQTGITPGEYERIREMLLQRIKPDNMNLTQLRTLLETTTPSANTRA